MLTKQNTAKTKLHQYPTPDPKQLAYSMSYVLEISFGMAALEEAKLTKQVHLP